MDELNYLHEKLELSEQTSLHQNSCSKSVFNLEEACVYLEISSGFPSKLDGVSAFDSSPLDEQAIFSSKQALDTWMLRAGVTKVERRGV